METIETQILRIVKTTTARTGRPCTTIALELQLGCYSHRSCQYILARMEQVGQIARLTPHSGWLIREDADRIEERYRADPDDFPHWLRRHFSFHKDTVTRYIIALENKRDTQ